jgi:hypothetical protein
MPTARQLAKILSNFKRTRLSGAAAASTSASAARRGREPHPSNVVSGHFERRHGGARKVLIRQEAQLSHAALG